MQWPYDPNDVVNYEIDTVSFSCCGWRKVPVKSYSPTLTRKLERIHVPLACPLASYPADRHDRYVMGSRPFDNFLRYVVAASFPSLRELTADLDIGLDLEHTSRRYGRGLGVARVFRDRQMTPIFFRTEDGGGVHISPSSSVDESSLSFRGPDKIRVLFMKEKEASRFGGDGVGVNPLEHRDVLDRLGIYLCHVFSVDDSVMQPRNGMR
ncbi:hypothetical protein PG997_014993 [Apiospora hydei]|uniref:Uncharacterized protein n=1 Tax=Apiospora hydei TaxID=1337664 RepID=A0ABR1UVD9_9PEZI